MTDQSSVIAVYESVGRVEEAEATWDSPETAALVRQSCADCHSNQTQWPWYSYVPPVSLLVANHVREGREVLNFSEWVPGREQEIKEIVEVIRSGEMPMPSYLRMHPEATLTSQQQEQLIAGFQRSLNIANSSGKHDDD
jgi:mono/diheme cytochrome c family protein